MARPRKGPWRRGEKGHWYTTIGREIIKLADKSKSYEDAFDEYIKLLSCRENVRPDQLTINALFYRFLDWCEQHRSETTYNFYKRYLGSFEAFIRVRRVADLLPRHVEDWIDRRHDDCSDTTKNDLMKAVNRAINWGIEKRYLKHNPLAGMKRPSRSPRELVLTQDQFRQMLVYVEDQEFRDYLEFLWQTGCRAMEIRIIEARHFDGEMITLPRSKAKGKRHARHIYLNPVALEIVKRRCEQFSSGPIFRNPSGKPWTANNVRRRFKSKKGDKLFGLAIKMDMEGLCATTLRHSWATHALKSGTDSTTASILMGHQDPATLMRNYQHLAKDQEYLKSAVKAIPISVPLPVDTAPTAAV
jgi:integrase